MTFMKSGCPWVLTLTLMVSQCDEVRGGVVVYSDRTAFEAATSEMKLDMLSDGFESLRPETSFRSTPAVLFEGHVTISETDTRLRGPRDFNRIVAVPTGLGDVGIDGTELSGNYLLGRVQRSGAGGEQYLTFTTGFEGRAHAVGFDLSGAAGGASHSDGPHLGIEVSTRSGVVETMQILNDEGFIGVVTSSDDPLTSFRLLDVNENNTITMGEGFAMDNLVVGVLDAGGAFDPFASFSFLWISDPAPGAELGHSVAAPGDVDGDGIPDYAVSGSRECCASPRLPDPGTSMAM